MKPVALCTVLGFVCAFRMDAAPVDAWIVEPPPTISGAKLEQKSALEFFEVVVSMWGHAEFELKTKSYVAVSEERARKLAGRCYSCPKGKRPYLIRAVVGFAGTGAFHVTRIGQSIWVAHESLGPEFFSARSALIVNLDFEPSAAYATVSIAE